MSSQAEDDHYYRMILERLEAAKGYEEAAEGDSRPWDVEPCSALAGDDRKADPYHVSHMAWQSLTVAVDHLHCFRESLVQEVEDKLSLTLYSYSQYSLMRGALENSARAAWLLGPSSRAVRIERRLALQASDHRASDRLRELLGATPPRPLPVRMRQLVLLAVNAGISVDDGSTEKRLRGGAQTTEIVKAAGGIIGMGGNEAQAVWSACSSLAHGDLHSTLSILDREITESDATTALLRVTSSPKVLYWVTDRSVRMTEMAFKLYDDRRRCQLN